MSSFFSETNQQNATLWITLSSYIMQYVPISVAQRDMPFDVNAMKSNCCVAFYPIEKLALITCMSFVMQMCVRFSTIPFFCLHKLYRKSFMNVTD
jgi:hypothetical protein